MNCQGLLIRIELEFNLLVHTFPIERPTHSSQNFNCKALYFYNIRKKLAILVLKLSPKHQNSDQKSDKNGPSPNFL